MPAQSKSQQRFFGVVKAMQKGDIPKKGKAGKIAKTMSKKDVDDFASTKHKGKPEKVKREQRVRNLIKKMVREELAKMNEVKLTELTKFTPAHIKQLQKAFKNVKGILPDSNPVMQKLKQMLISVDRKTLTQIADADINILSTMAKKKLGFSEEKIIEISGVDVAKKVLKNKQHEKGIDMQTANLIVTIHKAYNKNKPLQKKFEKIPLKKMKELILRYMS